MFFKNQKFLVARFVLILALLSSAFGVLRGKPAYAAALVVTTTNDSGPGSLRQAILDAAPGDTIEFDPSLAGQTIILGSEINLDKDLIIDGSGLDPAIEISGNLAVRIFYIPSNRTVTLDALILKEGRSSPGSNGGAIDNHGNLTVTNSMFVNNATPGRGGAIHSESIINVSNSTFSSNSASSGGAIFLGTGLFVNPVGSPTIVNNTFVSNQADPATGSGGGLNNFWNASELDNPVVLMNNTFYGNGAHTGGGLYSRGKLDFMNNLFANSTSGGNCVVYMPGTTGIGANNLFDDGIPCAMGYFVSGDPLLGPLSDHGGPTLTMALLPGSPAIDAGTLACSPTDQRGVTRPQGQACDIGAFEYVDPLLPTITPTATYTPTFTETPTFTPTATPSQTPTNTATYTPSLTNTPSPTFTPTSTPPYSYHPLLLSFTDSHLIGGIVADNEDILNFDGRQWVMGFDGSDVGLSGTDLVAFYSLDSDTILVSLSNPVTVNGVSATPQDILRFDATSLGAITSGTFSMYFDGSDVGLSKSSESIDALSVLPNGDLLISTMGNPSVPGLVSGRDEDVLIFTPAALGHATSGTWALYFDGSDAGLSDASENVDALDIAHGNIYLSTSGNFSVTGVQGANEDVFVCAFTSLGSVTACDYSTSLYFDGSTWGLAASDVDAFHVAPPPFVVPTSPAITVVP